MEGDVQQGWIDEDVFGSQEGYQPEKVKDDFGVIKGTFNAKFNAFDIEPYEGKVDELKGTEIVKYELEIITEGDNKGRKLWKRFYLGSKTADKKGKLDVNKLMDLLFTLGFNKPSSREEAIAVLKLAKETVVEVKAWGWKPKDKDTEAQMHTIKGQGSSTGTPTSGAAPF